MGDSRNLPETFVPGFHDEKEVRRMSYSNLGNTGMKVSQLSLGTGGFSYLYGEFDVEECKKMVLSAVQKGVNFIDTAPFYGHGVSEEVLGKCLEGIPRQAYYLATKLCRYEQDPKIQFNFSAEHVKKSIELSLKRLGVDYVDLLQVHDIEFAESLELVVNETLPAVAQIVKSGKAKHIGITGYPVSTLAACLAKSTVKIESILSYSRLTMIDSTLENYLPTFQAHNLGIINAASHAMGLLTNRGPPNWHPASQHIKFVCTEARNYCKEHNVELGKLAFYYSLQKKGPHTNLVGMNTRVLLESNLDVMYNGLTPKELEVYDHVKNKILSKLHGQHWENFEVERHWKLMRGE